MCSSDLFTRPYISNVFLGAEAISDGFIGRFAQTFGFETAQTIFDAARPGVAEPGETPA